MTSSRPVTPLSVGGFGRQVGQTEQVRLEEVGFRESPGDLRDILGVAVRDTLQRAHGVRKCFCCLVCPESRMIRRTRQEALRGVGILPGGLKQLQNNWGSHFVENRSQ